MGDVYRHFKGGIYVVVGYVMDATNGADPTPMVLYVPKDQIRAVPKSFFCRSLDEFLSPVDKKKYPDATQYWRFEKIGELLFPVTNYFL